MMMSTFMSIMFYGQSAIENSKTKLHKWCAQAWAFRKNAATFLRRNGRRRNELFPHDILNFFEALVLSSTKLDFSKSQETYPIHFDCKGDEKSLDECETQKARPCECDLLEHTTDVFIECEGQREKKFKYSSAKRPPVLSFMTSEESISEGKLQ
ncbi:Oidioi.mRNA.OKI2018_I69.chr2.g5569.t1.cds [Oikopleura dioica]|uniref:Oidioi.mRNA.OKI2018_I69.chr2.g5569.t1.cds n=1 Tax=Oikopleura dioica TaxID=34765 RepID=A0ABN7T7A2_OIKDI|nr:Oidioi.mRNA.OKI2018_I69.chr2.g5569.t1.cds [Oikopleura dioica]